MAYSGPKAWVFARVWNHMAERGEVDAYGGAEYRRVLAEWFRHWSPGYDEAREEMIEDFIRDALKASPEGRGGSV